MIMAERAADCLAKLGLEQPPPPPPPPPSTIATNTQSLSSLGKDEQQHQQTISVNSLSSNFGKQLSSNLSHCSSPASSSSSSPSSSSPSQQQHLSNGGGYVLCGGTGNQDQLLFGAPHQTWAKLKIFF